MGKLSWYVNRLKAMNVKEVMWRLDQKRIQREEKKRFGSSKENVGKEVWLSSFSTLKFNCNRLGLNFENKNFGTCTQIHLLKGSDYDRWPDIFSYSLDYKQRDDLGDARSNWEKDRHFDWVLLAKAFYVTGDEKYLFELQSKVDSWMGKNAFLHGIAWTSAMEFAIRAISWMYALAFLEKKGHPLPSLQNGILNIVEYLTKHYSRYSSANNHLLVEATAIGLAGYAFDFQPWKELATNILTEELYKQNYSDGVNKELSLHYQTFGMEAYLLLAHVSGETKWNDLLKKEAEFVVHSSWHEKSVCEFGDDDEGKILDLQGGEWHQWEWVLQLASLITGIRYSSFKENLENTHWLFSDDQINKIKQQPLFDSSRSKCFKEGGNTFLRDSDDRILIGIDHAELGFGSIAAHGHADALSFQLYVDGQPIIVDPGTYIYHCDIEHRNSFRRTINHNTLCLIDKNDGSDCYLDQSEMLGAFLWGKRANCNLEEYTSTETKDVLVASHDGYRPYTHQRRFVFDKISRTLTIQDTLSDEHPYVITFMLAPDVHAEKSGNTILLSFLSRNIEFAVSNHDEITIEDAEVSFEYGVKKSTKAIRIYGHKKEISTLLNIKI